MYDKNRFILGSLSAFHYFELGGNIYLLNKKDYIVGQYDLTGQTPDLAMALSISPPKEKIKPIWKNDRLMNAPPISHW